MIAAVFFTMAAANWAALVYWSRREYSRPRTWGVLMAAAGVILCTAAAVDSLRRGE